MTNDLERQLRDQSGATSPARPIAVPAGGLDDDEEEPEID